MFLFLHADDNYRTFLSYISTHFNNIFTSDLQEACTDETPDGVSQFSNIDHFVEILLQIAGMTRESECLYEKAGEGGLPLVEEVRSPSPDLIFPEEFEFVSPVLLNDAVQNPKEHDKRTSESHVDYPDVDASGQSHVSLQCTELIEGTMTVRNTGSMLNQGVPAGKDDLPERCSKGEEPDDSPKLGHLSGQLNILQEEEELDDEEYEAEFWFERSVHENDEERFTVKGDLAEQNRSDSDIDLSNPSSEKVGENLSDSDKDLNILCGESKQILGCQSDTDGSICLKCDIQVDIEQQTHVPGIDKWDEEVKQYQAGVDDSACVNSSVCHVGTFSSAHSTVCDYKVTPDRDQHVITVTSFALRPQITCHLEVDTEKGDISLLTKVEKEKNTSIHDTSACKVPISECDLKEITIIVQNVQEDDLSEEHLPECNVPFQSSEVGSAECQAFEVRKACSTGDLKECELFEVGTKKMISQDSSITDDHMLGYTNAINKPEHCTSQQDHINLGIYQKLQQENGSLDGEKVYEASGFLDNNLLDNVEENKTLDRAPLIAGYDTEIESLSLSLPTDLISSDIKNSEPGLKPNKSSSQGDVVDTVSSFQKDRSNKMYVRFSGFDNPAFFSEDLPEETCNEANVKNICSKSCGVNTGVCCLNPNLPTIVVEECISDDDFSDKFVYDESGVCYEVYEEIDQLAGSFVSNGETGIIGDQPHIVFDRVNIHNHDTVNMSEGVIEENGGVIDCICTETNETNDLYASYLSKTDLDKCSTAEVSHTTSLGRPEKTQDDSQTVDEVITRNVLSPMSFIQAFEEEVHFIYSKYGDTKQGISSSMQKSKTHDNISHSELGSEFPVVKSNIGLLSCHDTSDLQNSRTQDCDKLNSEKILGNKPCESEKVDGDDTSKIQLEGTYTEKKEKISLPSVEYSAVADFLAQVSFNDYVYIDELYTSYAGSTEISLSHPLNDDNGLYEMIDINYSPLTQMDTVLKGVEGINEMKAKGTIIDPILKQEEHMYTILKQDDSAELNVNQEFHNVLVVPDIETEDKLSLPGLSDKSSLVNENMEPPTLPRNYDETVSSGGDGERSVHVEAVLPVESEELKNNYESGGRPVTAVLGNLMSTITQTDTIEQQSTSSQARSMSLWLQPDHGLNKGLMSSGVGVMSCVAMDEEKETVVCSSSFCSEGVQTTVISTVNLGAPSLEVDVAVQKQSLHNVDGTLELGEASGESESGTSGLPNSRLQANQLVPTVSGYDVRRDESTGHVTFRVSHRVMYSDMLTCALNFVDVLFWICLAVAIIVFDFRNWNT